MITTLKGDITGLDFDLIVNAANERLLPGNGVCGAIFSKAGPGLFDECNEKAPCPTGQVVLTKAYDLPCKGVIHAVGPIYIDGQHGEEEYLKACYWNACSTAYSYARSHHLDRLSLAFPCISTGIYGFPHKEACQIAVSTVQQLMKEYPDAKILDICFVCYLEEDYILYKEMLANV